MATTPLNRHHIQQALVHCLESIAPTTPEFNITIFDEIDSTNTALIKQSANTHMPSGTVYATEHQTAGRGQQTRQWHDYHGEALMFSLLWHFKLAPNALPGLSLAISLGILRALQKLGIPDIQLKWPNDIVYRLGHSNGGKLGGILVETHSSNQNTQMPRATVVIGVGLNVQLSANTLSQITQPSVSLHDLGYRGDRNLLLASILAELATLLPTFEAAGFAPFRTEWEAHHAMQQQPARVHLPPGDSRGQYLDGTVLGVSDHGALRFSIDGQMVQLYSGEIRLQPIYESNTVQATGPNRIHPT